MMNNKTLFSATGLVLTGLFLLISVAVISLIPRWRVDLTEDSLYTLADGTRTIVSSLERPVELLFFYSEEATANVPQLRSYGVRVQELLREMVIASDGKLSLRVIDPVPFSEEEDQAGEYGVQRVPLSQGGEEVFFGLVALDTTTLPESGEEEGAAANFKTLGLIRPDQEEFLEYEFSKLITQVANPKPPVVGFLSSLPIDGGVNTQTMRPTSPWMIMDSIRQLYEVRRISPEVKLIDEDISILLLVHPQNLSEQTQYAIDQFVLRGGRAMVFLDPNADAQAQPGQDGVPVPLPNQSSDIAPLLSAWGVAYDPARVVADRELALMVNVGDATRPVQHYGMLGVQRQGFANDITTTGLQVMNFSSVGALSPVEGATTNFEPLVRSSANAMLMEGEFFKALTDPTILLDEFQPTDTRYTIAARVSGNVHTAFPDGPPPASAEATDSEEDLSSPADETAQEPVELPPHLSDSNGTVNLIIVADTDLLGDRMWVQVQNFLGQRIPQAFASNGDFVMNALDNLAGNAELVTIRSRGRYARPFLAVIELQRDADDRLRQEETELLDNLRQTEQQISALNASNQGSGPSAEQQAEIDRFYAQQLETRRRLREVQLTLNRNIERLGSTLKFINTALVPILLVIFVLVMGYMRRRRAQANRD
ncbi:MAG: Gldg family protein [Gammaproteobacteria bacterium]